MNTLILVALLSAGLRADDNAADLILKGGKVFLGPGRFASAVAVSGNRIAAVGSDAAILRLKGPKTRLIELKGRAVTPGFHDSHAHLLKGALFLTQVDLNGAASVAEVQKRVREYAASHPGADWVLGRGWDETAWPGGKLPTREDLDAAISTRPVALTDVDGHKMWLNSEGLRLAGVSSAGVLAEEAMASAAKVIPPPDRQSKLNALRKALELARANGVTAFDSMPGIVDTPPEEQLELWRQLSADHEATARLILFGRLDDPQGFAKLRALALDLPRTRVLLAGLKGFVDGVIGSRTAALLEPYFDAPQTRGAPKPSQRSLDAAVRSAHARGFQVALHAVGDRAVRMALDACEKSQTAAREEGQVLAEFPCRIEHAEVIDPADIKRFAALHVASSMQPTHMTYDNEVQNYNPERLGDRVRWAFAWRSLEEAGALVAFGTDWPVMPLPPRLALFAATTRRHFNGKPVQGWIPQEKVSLESAVSHYTADPWRMAGLGDQLGVIKAGRIADLVVFDRDLFKTSGQDLLKVEVDATIFDGKVVFER